jgi:hypothetical protein
MSRTPWALSEGWRDYEGMWNPGVEPWIAPLGVSKCHAPRIVQLPPIAQSLVPAMSKLEYNFRLQPGSVIYGVVHNDTQGLTAMQLTDVGMGHSLFQEPAAPNFSTVGDTEGWVQSLFLLPCPWPVVGEGLFTFEVWNNSIDELRAIFQLYVGEVTNCPVR